MFAMGIIGWLAGVLYRKGVLRRGRLSLCIFGVIASTIIYGGIMNPASALMWSNTINWKIILSYYVTGLPVDLVRAIATFFLPVVDCRTHARKARPRQSQIRLGRVSSFVEMPFGLQRYTIAINVYGLGCLGKKLRH